MKTTQRLVLAASIAVLAATGCSSGPTASNTPPPIGPQGNTYQQIELLSRPAVKELFEQFSNHDATNRSSPYADAVLPGEITTFTNAFRDPAYGAALKSILTPNEIAVDLSQAKAAYLGVETGGATGGTFGGRSLTDNVIDTSLGVVFGNTLNALKVVATDDGKENNCLITQNVTADQGGKQSQASFPYLATPH